MHIKKSILCALLFGLMIGQTLEVGKLAQSVRHMQQQVQALEDEQADLRQRIEGQRVIHTPDSEVIAV